MTKRIDDDTTIILSFLPLMFHATSQIYGLGKDINFAMYHYGIYGSGKDINFAMLML